MSALGIQDRLDRNFSNACISASLKLVKLYVSLGANIHYNNDTYFIIACMNGYFDIIQYFITISKNNTKYSQDILDEGFYYACKTGHIDIAKYLVNIYQITDYDKINIHHFYEKSFIDSCMNGHLNIIKYLTTLYKTTEYNIINIHQNNEVGFIYACTYSYIHIVKYLINLYRKHKLYKPINIYDYDLIYTNGNCLTRTIDLKIIKYIANLGFYREDSYVLTRFI